MEQLQQSRYLNIVKSGDHYNVYNSLLGNLFSLSEEALELLNQFTEKTTINDVLKLYDDSRKEEIIQFCTAFKEWYYIVNPEFDERIIIQELLKQREDKINSGDFIGGIQLNVTNTCNFSCYYCFVNSTEKRRQRENPNLDHVGGLMMSFETAKQTIENTIDILKSNGKNQLVIKFFGREPLINWKLIKEIMLFFNRGEKYNIGISYTITTNGSLITEEVAKLFGEYRVFANVSIDGTKDSNNAIRTQKNGKETFNAIKQGLDYLLKYNVDTNLSAVITKDNFDKIGTDFIDFAKQYNCSSVQILLGMQDDYLQTLTVGQIVNKLYEIYSYGIRHNVDVVGYWHNAFAQLYNTSYDGKLKKMNRILDSCTATGFQISVEPNGDIYPCKAMSLHLGNINDMTKMINSKPYHDVIMRTYGNVEECKNCPIEGFCQGVCLGDIEEKYHTIYRVAKHFCDIDRGITKKILENI